MSGSVRESSDTLEMAEAAVAASAGRKDGYGLQERKREEFVQGQKSVGRKRTQEKIDRERAAGSKQAEERAQEGS